METDDLVAAVRAALAGSGTVREIKMFGGVGFMLNGNMVAAASKRGLLLRVGREREKDALAKPGARPMVMRGQAMGGYAYVDPPALHGRAVRGWIRLASDYVKTLPAKTTARKPSRSKGKGR